jgi:hypothetical protein
MQRSVTKQEIIDDIEQLRKRSDGTDDWIQLTYPDVDESSDLEVVEWESISSKNVGALSVTDKGPRHFPLRSKIVIAITFGDWHRPIFSMVRVNS